MNKLPLLLVSLLFASSCIEDDAPMVAADSEAVVVCDCELPTAADVSYDNAGSDLSAVEVEGALHELAARQAPDFGDRIKFVENEDSNTPADRLVVVAACNGGTPDHTVIGGGCRSNDSNATLLESGIMVDVGFRCTWKKPLGVPATGTAQVTCITPLL